PVQILNGLSYVPVAVPNTDGLTLIGLFSPEQLLSESLSIISDQEPVTIIVVDPAYRILYRRGNLNPEEDLSTHPGFKSALNGVSGVDYLQTVEGEHVITSSSIQPVGWALMIEESWEDIASPLLQTTQNAPLIIIPVLGLAMLALWFGLRQIVQPMQALEKKAGDLATGNFDTIREPVGGVPEIGHLQNTLVDMAEKVEEAQDSLHSYIGAITDSVENERRNLARELHDDTLQSLIAMGQFTQYAKYWNKDEKVNQTLDQMTEQTDQAVKNLRRLVQGLRPIYIEDLGLATALAMQASRPGQSEGVIIHFSQEGQERRFKPEVEMAFYRMAQEALSNIHRHSDARNGWITLTFRADEIILEIRDDGKGFELPPDPVHYARKGHYGLLGLYERADLIGAKLTIQSSPGDGVLIRVRLSDTTKGTDTQAPSDG
ncbi:HAMP domain-containing protein, partial [bacterium]